MSEKCIICDLEKHEEIKRNFPIELIKLKDKLKELKK